MTSLEDKILGEKKHYYCSSSESDNNDSDDENNSSENINADPGPPPLNPTVGNCSTNTGPKGVISDWQQYKQIESEQRIEREKERLALIKKLSLTCRSDLAQEKEEDPELTDFLEDPFLLEYSRKKIEEMLGKNKTLPKFGEVLELSSSQDFLDAIDKENKEVTIIVHIFDEKLNECKLMNSCLNELCKEYPEVKFCKLLASNAGVSKHFKLKGVPALLIYKNQILIGNFVKISEELGAEFTSNDLENFLIDNGMIIDKSLMNISTIRHSGINNSEEID